MVLQKLGDGSGPSGGVLHVLDCEDAPRGAPLLDLHLTPWTSRRTWRRGCAPRVAEPGRS
jgi:hypothetical protein